MKNTDDIYEILQVHHAAEPEVIEAAYRRLLRMYHPDVNKASEAHEITVRLNTAYEVLRDPGKRANYDRERTSQTRHDYRQQEQQAHGERQRREQNENIEPVLNANNNKRKSGQKDRDKNIGSGKGRPKHKHRLVLSKNGKSNVSGCYLIAFFRQ